MVEYGVTLGGKKSGDKIQGNMRPWSAGHRDWAKKAGRWLVGSLPSGRCGTSRDVLPYIFHHSGPPKLCLEDGESAHSSSMAGHTRGMSPMDSL